MKAINKNIMVFEVKEPEKKSEGGIILTDKRIDFSNAISNRVISVGGDVKYVKEGDTIYYLPTTGDVIKTDNGVYRVFDESQVVAVE